MINAIAPWYGSNRILAEHVGKALGKLDWVGIPFAGGMAEVPAIKARAILVNDLHRDVINLSRTIKAKDGSEWLARTADENLFHPDELTGAQEQCGRIAPDGWDRALAYFVAIWMGRSANAGTDGELEGGLAMRFTASGGGSNVRYRSAIASIPAWHKVFLNCEFSTLDVFEFLEKCHDREGHGIYCDPPFPGPGDAYKHKFNEAQHAQLAFALGQYSACRVVCRFYDHPLIRCLYPESGWEWRHLEGRKQSNDKAPEVLLINRGIK